jgi:hypothetical protein
MSRLEIRQYTGLRMCAAYEGIVESRTNKKEMYWQTSTDKVDALEG